MLTFLNKLRQVGAGFEVKTGGIRFFHPQRPLKPIVLETDAPDIPPVWLRDAASVQRNEPGELPRIAQTMMELRGVRASELAQHNRLNASAALPRLARLLEAETVAAPR